MNYLKAAFKNSSSNRGFVLPVALTMGIVMVLVGVAAVARSQSIRLNSFSRSQTVGGSSTVAEGGVARTLAQLTKPNNSVLLTGNYDSINPKTNKTYLGADGILNSGDEENTLVDEWASAGSSSSCGATSNQGTTDITYDGIIGDSDSYALKAYRYNDTNGTGTLLIEGKRKTSVSLIKVIVTVDSVAGDFPGVAAIEKMELRGRDVTGSDGNVYYDPAFSTNTSLTESAAPGDANRPDYLNAIKSGTNDYDDDNDSIDNISGKIVACKINPTFPYNPQGTTLGALKTNRQLSGSSGKITYFQADKIELKEDKTVKVDTTAGAVYIYINGSVRIEKGSQIRNVRTDGIPPRVGDLRIIISTTDKTEIKDNACIQNAFFYAPRGKLQLDGSDNGCPSGGNSNIDGVVWAKEIINNTNGDSGVAIPDDVSSLSDIANSTGFAGTKKFGTVKSWQRQQQ